MSPALAVAARVVSWPPLLVAGLVSTTMVAATLGGDAAFPMQAASILLASAVGYALDDPAADVLGPTPTSLLRRRGHRIVVALPPAAALWTVLLVWHGTTGPAETLALVAMFAGLLGLALAVAGISVRRSTHGSGGMFVAPILFGLLLASTLFPPRWRPLPMGDIPGGWFAIDSRWFVAAAIGVAALLVSSRDPAGGRVRR